MDLENFLNWIVANFGSILITIVGVVLNIILLWFRTKQSSLEKKLLKVNGLLNSEYSPSSYQLIDENGSIHDFSKCQLKKK